MDDQGVGVDPVRAFDNLQQLHGMEMGRLGGELAKNAAVILQLQQENSALKERITALEQNMEDRAGTANGAVQSGADLSKTEIVPRAPTMLRKVKDAPQA